MCNKCSHPLSNKYKYIYFMFIREGGECENTAVVFKYRSRIELMRPGITAQC